MRERFRDEYDAVADWSDGADELLNSLPIAQGDALRLASSTKTTTTRSQFLP
jgi:hypothetical protein